MNTKIVSLVFGVILVVVGILGFVPNPLVAPNGIFAVNAIHNLVHILTGGVFLVGAIMFQGIEGMVLKVVGAVYALVAILGFFTSGGMLLGIVQINGPDNWLHVGLAIAILWSGFALPQQTKPA